MPDHPQNLKQKLISQEAADWLVRLRAGGVPVDDRRQYVRWLKQSPAHVREMLELASLEELLRMACLGSLGPPIDPSEPPSGGSSVIELVPKRKRKDPPSDSRQSGWHHWKSAASACFSRIEFAGRALSKIVGSRH